MAVASRCSSLGAVLGPGAGAEPAHTSLQAPPQGECLDAEVVRDVGGDFLRRHFGAVALLHDAFSID